MSDVASLDAPRLGLLFFRLILRPLRRELVRSTLTAVSVALGVAVVVAIDLAGRAAAGSFHSAIDSLSAQGDLEITQTGGIDEEILGRLAQLPQAFVFSPRIEDFATVSGVEEAGTQEAKTLPHGRGSARGIGAARGIGSARGVGADPGVNGQGEAVLFLGLDLVGGRFAANNTDTELTSGAQRPSDFALQAGDDGPIWAGSGLGLKGGDRVRLLINDQFHLFRVQGILPESPAEPGENNILVTDIGIAQTVTGKTGKLDSISVMLPRSGRSASAWTAYLGGELPPGTVVEPRGARTEENRKMLEAFRSNLRILSYIALIVGAFLIYNTISVSVVRRRNEIGIVRALGGTRVLILCGFLGEALFFALIGSLAGLAGGRFLALGAVRLLGATVRALYTTADPGPVAFTVSSFLAALAAGVGVSLLAAAAPALEASRVTPVEAMARGREEYVAHARSRWSLALALLLACLAVIAALLPPAGTTPVFGYLSCLLAIASATLAVPALLKSIARGLSRPVSRTLGVEAMLALRSLEASLGRSSVLIAALAIAVAMMSSVGIMVSSFRETVSAWLDQRLEADLYLSPAGFASADQHPRMDASLADRIERLPGVAAVDRSRVYSISFEGLPATLAAGELVKLGRYSRIRLLAGENSSAVAELGGAGNVLVSEPFANKHHLHPGDVIRLPLGRLPLGGEEPAFRIAGIFYDYSSERGLIAMNRPTLLKYLPDPAVSSVAVYLKLGADSRAVRKGIDQAISGRGIVVIPHAAIRRAGMATFDRTFRITWALEAVAIAVAIMGIASALLAMVLDRRRQFGLLRFLGCSLPQVRRLILAEAAFLGLVANAVGLVLGVALSLVLIYVVNKQSFGWTIQFHWPVALLLSALTAVYAATIASALYPTRTAMRLNPIEVVHEE